MLESPAFQIKYWTAKIFNNAQKVVFLSFFFVTFGTLKIKACIPLQFPKKIINGCGNDSFNQIS